MVHAKTLFKEADKDGDGKLCVTELRDMLRTASKTYSHFEEHSLFLDRCECTRGAEGAQHS